MYAVICDCYIYRAKQACLLRRGQRPEKPTKTSTENGWLLRVVQTVVEYYALK